MSNIYGLVKIYGDITEADYPEFILFFFCEEVASAKASTKRVRTWPQTKRDGTGEEAGKNCLSRRPSP